MDIPRQVSIRKRRLRATLYGFAGVSALAVITTGLARLKPAPPTVDRATVWIDTVKRGSMYIQVRGLGRLAPETIQVIPATTEGQVVRRLVLPGTPVEPETVLLVLSNPVLQQLALDAEWQLKAAQAEHESLKATLERQVLDGKAAAATVVADYHQARLQADVDEKLARGGLGAEVKAELSRAKADGLATRKGIEEKRVTTYAQSERAQLAVQQAKIEQLRALYELKRRQLETLNVRAGIRGVLQEMSVELGQRVTPGTTLAKVVDPARLKAELKIAETQAKDIQLGQVASIDTHNGVVPGRVTRIDPAVQNGTVTVDVALEGALPPGARPDLSVDGTVEVTRLDDTLYVGRPAFGQTNSTVGIFKVVNGGKEALRVQVRLGRASVITVEILKGLNRGDEVILSDMSRWDGFDRIRLE